jgi:hypothetical protein
MQGVNQLINRANIIHGVKYEFNYASGDYSKVHLAKPNERFKIPIILATKDNLQGYGFLVRHKDYKNKLIKPEIRQWPPSGWRNLAPGTGFGGGTIKGKFINKWVNDLCLAENTALGNQYIIGRRPRNSTNSVLVREVNYHPDGGQIFMPLNGQKSKFIVLMAKPTDNIQPDFFKAFLFEGTDGIHINAGTWHKPAYPLLPSMKFIDEQGKVHGVVCMDSYNEFGQYLEIPLPIE